MAAVYHSLALKDCFLILNFLCAFTYFYEELYVCVGAMQPDKELVFASRTF